VLIKVTFFRAKGKEKRLPLVKRGKHSRHLALVSGKLSLPGPGTTYLLPEKQKQSLTVKKGRRASLLGKGASAWYWTASPD